MSTHGRLGEIEKEVEKVIKREIHKLTRESTRFEEVFVKIFGHEQPMLQPCWMVKTERHQELSNEWQVSGREFLVDYSGQAIPLRAINKEWC